MLLKVVKRTLGLFVLVLAAGATASCAVGRVDPEAPPPISCTWGNGVGVSEQWEFGQVMFRAGQLRIGALLTKPKGTGPFPAYIHNHGSMTIQQASRPLWSIPGSLEFILVPAGYVVLRPARRGYLGSEGWTTTYTATGSSLRVTDVINGAYDEAEDVKAAFVFLTTCPFVDRGRIAIGGHSVGGLVTIIAAAQLPKVAAVASMNGGIGWTDRGMQVGTPAVMGVWSSEASKIKAPVLVLHGRDDAKVDPALGRSLAETLRNHETPVKLQLYPGGHDWFPVSELLGFLDEHFRLPR